jgi:hypothetical protein
MWAWKFMLSATSLYFVPHYVIWWMCNSFKYTLIYLPHVWVSFPQTCTHYYKKHRGVNLYLCVQFLSSFAKLQKAPITFVMSARWSVWNNSAPTRWIFMKFDIGVFFKQCFLEWEIFQTNIVQKMKTHILR